MTDLILLAAGAARRFGRQKLLEEFEGKPLYRYAFDAARSLSGVRVLAVTRAGLLDGAAVDYRFEPVLVPEEQGIGLSVAGQHLRSFLGEFYKSGKSMGRMRTGARFGSPTIFAPQFRPALMALTGDEGGRRIFAGREGEIYYHDAAPEVLLDFDRPWANRGDA